MAVIVGHASIDERGKISGGVAGDQTGKEVCQRSFYMHKKGWYVLRAKDDEVAEKIAQCMEWACANPFVGYDQYERLDLYDSVKNLKFKCDINTLKVYVECDCSSLVRTCMAYAGIKVGNFTTANEKAVILASGAFTEVVCKADGSNLKRGDILVTKTKGHTVIVLTNGSAVDSDGKYTQEQFIREVQKAIGAEVDGIGGSETLSKTITVSTWQNKRHAVVTPLERYMKALGYYDGEIEADEGKKPCFGSGMKKAIKKYQEEVVMAELEFQDGVITKRANTWRKLLGI